MNFMVDYMKKDDWESVVQIYKEGIDTNIATFQNEVPSWEEWDNGHVEDCRFVVRTDDDILGWAALSSTSSRYVYRGVVEVSIYIGERYKGKNIGTVLLNRLIEESEKAGLWTLQSGIIRDNIASINLHKKCGFREIGIRERVAKMNNEIWMDVVLMEHRSKVVGID